MNAPVPVTRSKAAWIQRRALPFSLHSQVRVVANDAQDQRSRAKEPAPQTKRSQLDLLDRAHQPGAVGVADEGPYFGHGADAVFARDDLTGGPVADDVAVFILQ
jgi:hypothetical protein